MRKFLSIVSLSVVAAFPTLAQDAGWYSVTSSKDGNDDYSIKLGSGARDQNKQGEPMTIVVGRSVDKKNNKIDLYKWYVTDSDCKQEYGQLVALDLDGNFKFETPYAKGSKTIGSAIAETICDVGETSSKEAAGKSV